MPIKVDRDVCPHDHVCPLIKSCPAVAISQGQDGYPVIDYAVCAECGVCVDECPKQAMVYID